MQRDGEVGNSAEINARNLNRLIFVDVESEGGGSVNTGRMTEFGAVTVAGIAFHGIIKEDHPSSTMTKWRDPIMLGDGGEITESEGPLSYVMMKFDRWLEIHKTFFHADYLVFVSDNPAFDWQWINDAFWTTLGRNPFGHSARRIGDFYAGVVKNWNKASEWKRLRVTPHDHNPVHDATGNVEAFLRILGGER
jgi:hypothetical protein